MVRLAAMLIVLLALLGATGLYVNSGTAGTDASRLRLADTAKEDSPLASNSLLLVGVGMIAVGVVGKWARAGK